MFVLHCGCRHTKAPGCATGSANQELDLLPDASILNERLWKPFVVKHSVSGGMLELTQDLLGAFIFVGKEDPRRHQWDYAPRDPRTPLDRNLNNASRAYEALMLEQGMVDERTFLAAEPDMSGALALTQLKTPQSFHKNRVKTNNRLNLSATMPTRSPVSRALNSIVMLKSLAGPGCPSDKIPTTFSAQIQEFVEASTSAVAPTWSKSILQRVVEFRKKFIAGMCEKIRDSEVVATERFGLATAFYYKALESIVAMEMQTRPGCSGLNNLLHHDAFNRSLIACGVEITLYAYQSDRTLFRFPWVLDTFDLCPFEFHKIIELVVRAECSLSAATIKHLSRCENTVLLCSAWQEKSTLHAVLKEAQTTQAAAAVNTSTSTDASSKADPTLPNPCSTTPTLNSGNTTFAASTKSKSLRALEIFYRKLFHLARLRLEHLCNKLKIAQDTALQVSACFRHAIEHNAVILPGFHIDQLMMCSIHAIWIVAGGERKIQFSDIIHEYRRLPQADPRVCYEVPLPTGHGDIIAYYNQVFVPAMQGFIFTLVEHASQKDLRAQNALPFPKLKNKRIHSPRRVARNMCLTVCPIPASRLSAAINQRDSPDRPLRNMSYAFHHSPSKNLRSINRHLRGEPMQEEPEHFLAGKFAEVSEGGDSDFFNDSSPNSSPAISYKKHGSPAQLATPSPKRPRIERVAQLGGSMPASVRGPGSPLKAHVATGAMLAAITHINDAAATHFQPAHLVHHPYNLASDGTLPVVSDVTHPYGVLPLASTPEPMEEIWKNS